MYSTIDDTTSAGLLLLQHVGFVLVVDKLDNGCPAVCIVDIVSEPGCINNGEIHLEVVFFQLSLC